MDVSKWRVLVAVANRKCFLNLNMGKLLILVLLLVTEICIFNSLESKFMAYDF